MSRQPDGMEAEASLKPLVEGTRVKIEIYQVDRDDKRRLATIFLDGQDINPAMLEAGPAEVYRGPVSGHPHQRQDQAAEEVAQAAKKGMWVLCDQDESPHDDRRRVGMSQSPSADLTMHHARPPHDPCDLPCDVPDCNLRPRPDRRGHPAGRPPG